MNGERLAFLLGMKGGVAGGHLPLRSIGGYGAPPKEGTSWRHIPCCKGILDLGELGECLRERVSKKEMVP